jgi:DNA-binding MarR family transcriptional regulator
MSLENDIHQREFRSEYHKALLNIIYTNNFLVDRLNDVFKNHDITRQQYNVLRILKGQLPRAASINLIKERMLDKMSDASRIVERLRSKDLVTRRSSDTDKRAAEVTITTKGLKFLEVMDPLVESCESAISHLSTDEVRRLNELLDAIRKPSDPKK